MNQILCNLNNCNKISKENEICLEHAEEYSNKCMTESCKNTCKDGGYCNLHKSKVYFYLLLKYIY